MTTPFNQNEENASFYRRQTPLVWMHETVLEETTRFLRESRGLRSRHEGIVYWAGRDFGTEWFVTTCLAPKANTTPGSYQTFRATNAKVISSMAGSSLQMLAQVHSHPGDWVEHSNGDNRGAFMPYENFLSVIVPSYGRKGIWPLSKCGVHRFESGAFRQLSDSEIDAAFRLLLTSIDLRKT